METLTKEKINNISETLTMTEDDFLEFCDEDTRAEFIDGEVIVHSPGTYKHQSISNFLIALFRFFVDQHQLGIVLGDNFQVRLRPRLRRVPDIIFISKENKDRIARTEFEGAPDLVVEVVSTESIERDWRDKYFEYEQAGVKEYWIIDPNAEKMMIYCLNDLGKYESQKPEKKILHSKVLPSFWLKSEWLWQDPLPNVIEIARELQIKI